MDPKFIHLRLHSEYSIADSVIRIPALVKQTAAEGLPAAAVTDIGNLFGLVKFYKACQAAGIKPIVGADMQVEDEAAAGGYATLVMLCANDTGYRNLKELITRSFVENYRQGTPVVRAEWLTEAAVEGLIVLSGARAGVIGQLLHDNKADSAAARIRHYSKLFNGDFFLELQRTGRTGEDQYIEGAVQLAAELQCPVVATNDVRFLGRGEFEAHEARTCVQSGYTLDDASRPRHFSDQQYLRSADEMAELFSDLPEALQNSVEIARRCNVELQLGHSVLPDYEIPTNEAPAEYLASIARAGLDQRLAKEKLSAAQRKAYDERLSIELDVIAGMGFPGYFLIVADFIRWAKENGVPVGPGRGSGAGSVVAWAIGITGPGPAGV